MAQLANIPDYTVPPRADGVFVSAIKANLFPSADVTAGIGNGDYLDLGGRSTVRLTRTVSALATGPLTVYLQHSDDASSWEDLGQFGAMSSTGSDSLSFGGCKRYVRVRYALAAGTATFAVTGDAPGIG